MYLKIFYMKNPSWVEHFRQFGACIPDDPPVEPHRRQLCGLPVGGGAVLALHVRQGRLLSNSSTAGIREGEPLPRYK